MKIYNMLTSVLVTSFLLLVMNTHALATPTAEHNDASVNENNRHNESSLFYAVERGLVDVAASLISSGAEVHGVYNKVEIWYHDRKVYLEHNLLFKSIENNDVPMTKLLLESGVNPNSKIMVIDDEGTRHWYSTLLFQAIEKYSDLEIIKMLISHGTMLNEPNYNERIGHTIYYRKPLNYEFHGKYPVSLAVETRQKDVLEILLDNGASPNQVQFSCDQHHRYGTQGWFNRCYYSTPLILAIKKIIARGKGELPGYDPLINLVKVLLEKGADPNFVHNKIKESPLAIATKSGLSRVVDLLLQYDANASFRDAVDKKR